jgi:hypothetical protein
MIIREFFLMNHRTIQYIRVGEGGTDKPLSFTFAARNPFALPSGSTNRGIFRAAIARNEGTPIVAVLNDLFRYLYHGHFAGEGIDLDREFPYRGTIPEGGTFAAAPHLSGKTNTLGATLHLLMTTRASRDHKALLGAVLWAMAQHRKYGGTLEHPGMPMIDEHS